MKKILFLVFIALFFGAPSAFASEMDTLCTWGGSNDNLRCPNEGNTPWVRNGTTEAAPLTICTRGPGGDAINPDGCIKIWHDNSGNPDGHNDMFIPYATEEEFNLFLDQIEREAAAGSTSGWCVDYTGSEWNLVSTTTSSVPGEPQWTETYSCLRPEGACGTGCSPGDTNVVDGPLNPICTPGPWAPDPSTVPLGQSFTQSNGCATQPAVGTMCTGSWSPATSTVCLGQNFTQSLCGSTRTATGTLNPGPWSPDASTIPQGQVFTQTNNCGSSQTAVGTQCVLNWLPDTSTVCAGQTFTQSSCGSTRQATGTWGGNATWTPDPSTVNWGQTFTQSNGCSTRQATGTMCTGSWTPAANTVCSGQSFTQSLCGSTRTATGTRTPGPWVGPGGTSPSAYAPTCPAGQTFPVSNDCDQSIPVPCTGTPASGTWGPPGGLFGRQTHSSLVCMQAAASGSCSPIGSTRTYIGDSVGWNGTSAPSPACARAGAPRRGNNFWSTTHQATQVCQ